MQLWDENGQMRSQVNLAPGRRPTRAWLPGEVVVTTYALELPADLAPGVYRLMAGLYDPGQPGLPRLHIQPGGADVVEVGRISLSR